MRIAIGSDHRGLEVKDLVIRLVRDTGHEVKDCGAFTTEAVDYPDIAREVAGAVVGGGSDHGILICGTGIGMSMAANKVKGIRAALCCNDFMATRAREHNDANILCMGAALAPDAISAIVLAYLTTGFEGGRHVNRVNKIAAMEG